MPCFLTTRTSPTSLRGRRSNWKFPGEIREGYLNANFAGAFKSYHTFAHALDVMLTCHCILETGLGKFFLKEEERTALILAAISHDVLHPGLSNPYFVNTKHEIALKYNNDAGKAVN